MGPVVSCEPTEVILSSPVRAWADAPDNSGKPNSATTIFLGQGETTPLLKRSWSASGTA
jgi:hypothetical protein